MAESMVTLSMLHAFGLENIQYPILPPRSCWRKTGLDSKMIRKPSADLRTRVYQPTGQKDGKPQTIPSSEVLNPTCADDAS